MDVDFEKTIAAIDRVYASLDGDRSISAGTEIAALNAMKRVLIELKEPGALERHAKATND